MAQEVEHGVTPLVLQWEAADWGPPTRPPPLSGRPAQRRPFATDPATGGPTYLARFPAGSEFAMHWHTYTETVVVLEGAVDIVMDGTRRTATAGSYVIIPGKAHHAWYTHPGADAVLLARRDGRGRLPLRRPVAWPAAAAATGSTSLALAECSPPRTAQAPSRVEWIAGLSAGFTGAPEC